MSLAKAFQSTIGKKIIMGLTGLFLVSFLVIHVTINSMVFFNDGGAMFNEWGHFMSHNYIVRFLEIGLFVGFIIHIYQGFALTFKNQKARSSKYAVAPGNSTSKWYSRSMGVLGSILLIFLVVHLSHFWIGTKASLYLHNDAPHNMFEEMKNCFSYWYIVLIYELGVIALAWHLLHGFPSAFRTLGLDNPNFRGIINGAGMAFSILVPLLFALMPLAFFFGWIK